MSDPAKPVPYRPRPNVPTYAAESTWGEWLVDDQRHAHLRPDALVLAEVYAAGEQPIVAADGRALMHALRVAGQSQVVFVENIQDMPQAIMQMARDGDVVVTMGAGTIGGVPNRLLGRSDGDASQKLPAFQTQQQGEL